MLVEADRFDVFEGMHYVCFHYEFEHDPADPDEECSAGGCPSAVVHPRPDRRPPSGTMSQSRSAPASRQRPGPLIVSTLQEYLQSCGPDDVVVVSATLGDGRVVGARELTIGTDQGGGAGEAFEVVISWERGAELVTGP